MKSVASFLLSLLLLAPTALAQVERNGTLPPPLPLFLPDNWWNLDVSGAPLDVNSANYITFIGGINRQVHPDFGGDDEENPPGIYGIPYVVVPGTQPRLPVTWMEFGNQSDDGAPGLPTGYPIPEEAKTMTGWIEGGWAGNDANADGDRHLLIVDRDNRVLYELYHTRWNVALNRWEAGSGAIFLLDRTYRRPETWTSADAAGLAILPGLVRYDEVYLSNQPIRHAFRVTVQSTKGYVWPASHQAGNTTNALPMGARLRLKATKDISGYPAALQKIFQAMKTYGLIVADNGTNMYVSGQYDTRWDNGILNPAFHSLKASDFEVIQLGYGAFWCPPPPAPAMPPSAGVDVGNKRKN